jgi:molybdopterin-guanine dinucleotide biosynthesis protein A
MGQDKALLLWGDDTLAARVARIVGQAVEGHVSLIGPPDRLNALGLPVYADRLPGRGPLGGLLTALEVTDAKWNLLVACDMPHVTAEALILLLDRADQTGGLCVAPVTPSGAEPLCAVYNADCLPAVRRALADQRLKMRDLLPELGVSLVAGLDPLLFTNVNTPADWAALPA